MLINKKGASIYALFFVRRYILKTNTMKYIFFTIVILMIGLAIYFLYIDSKDNVYALENNELEINMIKEINIGIYKYDTINPILSNNRDIQYINKLIFEPLIDITYDFKIENKLAKEISKINDLTYIIKLNEDIYWHDGEKFTAEDVTFTINCLKNNNIDSIYKKNVKCIQEVQIIDEYTIKLILNEDTAFFEYTMCIPIIANHSYDEKFNLKTELPIGTGEYKIAKIENEKVILLKPQTYMNLSGKSIIQVVNFYKIPLENICVIYDDMDIMPGEIKERYE